MGEQRFDPAHALLEVHRTNHMKLEGDVGIHNVLLTFENISVLFLTFHIRSCASVSYGTIITEDAQIGSTR